jgi:hypothetical protein
VNGESSDLDTMTASNILDKRRLTDNLHKLLTGVTLLVNVADVARSHLLVEGNADGVLYEGC